VPISSLRAAFELQHMWTYELKNHPGNLFANTLCSFNTNNTLTDQFLNVWDKKDMLHLPLNVSDKRQAPLEYITGIVMN
jgi:hypothetical protein